MFQRSGVERHPPEPKSQTEGTEDSGGKEQPWEMVMDKKHFKLWRRPITGTHLYQYRGEPSLAALQVCSMMSFPRCAGLLFFILSKPFVLVVAQKICHGFLFFVFVFLPDDKHLSVFITILYCRLSLSYFAPPM